MAKKANPEVAEITQNNSSEANAIAEILNQESAEANPEGLFFYQPDLTKEEDTNNTSHENEDDETNDHNSIPEVPYPESLSTNSENAFCFFQPDLTSEGNSNNESPAKEDDTESEDQEKYFNTSFELFPYDKNIFEKYSNLMNSLGHDTPLVSDNKDGSWCEDPEFREFYNQCAEEMELSENKENTDDNIIKDRSLDDTPKNFINDMMFFKKTMMPYEQDTKPEITECDFQAQMKWKVIWDRKSDDERDSSEEEMEDFGKENVLWPAPADEEPNYSCHYCNFRATSIPHLNQHIHIKHIRRQFKCMKCPFTTKVGKKLQKHIENKHVHKCRFCDFKTTLEEEFKSHMVQIHWNRRFWGCSKCSYITPKKQKLVDHKKVAHPNTGEKDGESSSTQKEQCFSCPYSSSSKKDLAVHLKTAHMQPKATHCVHCEYRPKSFRDHEAHMDEFHKTAHLS